jgi:hypothetical protein
MSLTFGDIGSFGGISLRTWEEFRAFFMGSLGFLNVDVV